MKVKIPCEYVSRSAGHKVSYRSLPSSARNARKRERTLKRRGSQPPIGTRRTCCPINPEKDGEPTCTLRAVDVEIQAIFTLALLVAAAGYVCVVMRLVTAEAVDGGVVR